MEHELNAQLVQDQAGVVAVGRSRGLNLIDLPTDVLVDIFDYFLVTEKEQGGKRSRDFDYPREAPDTHFKILTIQNARLACRRLNEIASRYLCRKLQVHLDAESLDRACTLLRNPLIAEGVRCVKVRMAFRPREMAESISRFAKMRMKQLEDLKWTCDMAAKRRNFQRMRTRTETSLSLEGANRTQFLEEDGHMKAIKTYNSILRSWKDLLRTVDEDFSERDVQDLEGNAFWWNNQHNQYELGPSEEVVEVDDEADSEHLRVLRESHKEYARKHQEQRRLIEDGVFARQLASAMAQVKYPVALNFVDSDGAVAPLKYCIGVLTDEDAFSQFMVGPNNWHRLELVRGGVTLSPAKLFSDLPITLHREGVEVRELAIGCFPKGHGYDMLFPSLGDSWADVGKSFENLQDFAFAGARMNAGYVPGGPIPAKECAPMISYLGAVLSSQALRSIRMSFAGFHTLNQNNQNDQNNRTSGYMPLGAMLQSVNWPEARFVEINSILAAPEDIRHLCEGVGPKLRTISLVSWDMRQGWEEGLDMLREMVTQRYCEIRLLSPCGDAFGLRNRSMPLSRGNIDPNIFKLAWSYVAGVSAENPITKARGVRA